MVFEDQCPVLNKFTFHFDPSLKDPIFQKKANFFAVKAKTGSANIRKVCNNL